MKKVSKNIEANKSVDAVDKGRQGNEDDKKALKLWTKNKDIICIQMRWIK